VAIVGRAFALRQSVREGDSELNIRRISRRSDEMGSFIMVSTPIETADRLRKVLLAFLVRLKGAMVNNCGDGCIEMGNYHGRSMKLVCQSHVELMNAYGERFTT